MPPAPTDLSELKARVSEAATAGKRIRVAGGSYSWSALVKNENQVVLRMKKLDRVLGHGVDSDGEPTVTVECGISIKKLTKALKTLKLTLVTPTLFPNPSIGGVLATGSHGVGFRRGNFSDQIQEMRIVCADGSDKVIRKGDADFPAAQVALGTLGVVYSVTLTVATDYPIEIDKRCVSVDYVLEEFDDLQRTYEFIEIFWFPLQKKMWLYLMNRTDAPVDERSWWKKIGERIKIEFEVIAAGVVIPWIAKHAPRATPLLNRLASRLSNREETAVQLASEAFHHQKAYAPAMDISYAIPADRAVEAWRKAIDLTHEFGRAERYPANLAFHCRFTGKSDAWLAPNYDRPTLYIEVATAKGTPGYETFFREIERRWLQFEPARPHWGKLFWNLVAIPDAYAKWGAFKEVRERWDPERTFLNEFLEKDLFKLPPRAGPSTTPRPIPDPGQTPTPPT
jgi:FAD/FMN-containing dehydrogenase